MGISNLTHFLKHQHYKFKHQIKRLLHRKIHFLKSSLHTLISLYYQLLIYTGNNEHIQPLIVQ